MKRRIPELDLTKSFIITISMIGIHTMYHLADWDALSSTVIASVLNVLATAWGGPVFMFCMGATLVFSHRQTFEKIFERGLHIITIGMFLNVLRWGALGYTAYATQNQEQMKELATIFNVDILQFAGLAFTLLALCKKLNMGKWGILILSVIMNVIGSLLIGHQTDSYVVNQILGYFYHTTTCSCFPLMNWFIFVAAGNVMGSIYKESENPDKWFRYIIPICGVIAVAHQYLSITGGCSWFKTLQNDWEFYSMMTPDALCIAFGVAPFMVGIFWMIGRLIPERWMLVLGHPSRHILQYYCVSWVVIMWIYSFLYFIEPTATLPGFGLRYLIVLAITTATILLYNRYMQSKVNTFFGRHKYWWYLAIWIGVLVFGIWYFGNYSEPYIMPY